MRYSLLSRFQGALLGAALGELRGKDFKKQRSPQPELTAQTGNFSQLAPTDQPSLGWVDIALDGAKCLIQDGQLNLANWHNHQLPQQFLGSTGTQFTGLSELAIATLPVMLFFHEEERKLQDKLQQVVATLNPQASQAGVLAVGYAIAQALKEKFTPFSLLPQTIGYLQASQLDVTLPAASTSTLPLVEQLLQVQTLLEQGAGLEQTLVSLLPSEAAPTADLAIALAFYCCLSTPEDFQLAVLRAARTGYQLPITCALTGALSGAYNSTAGIPVDWRISLDPGREILPLAAQLLATWSGVYQPTNFSSNASQVPTVAAPRVIRLR